MGNRQKNAQKGRKIHMSLIDRKIHNYGTNLQACETASLARTHVLIAALL